jgi:hypothetical protein
VSSAGLSGQNGTARISYLLDGSISSADVDKGTITLSLSSGGEEASVEVAALGAFYEPLILDISIVFGTSFDFSANLEGTVSYPDTFGGTDSTIVDALNSATLESITFLDAGGAEVQGALASDSGTNYDPFLSVPEPSRAFLFLLGVLGVMVRRRV